MPDSTLTRMHLSEAVFSEVGLSRYESAQLVEAVLTHISAALIIGVLFFLKVCAPDNNAGYDPERSKWDETHR